MFLVPSHVLEVLGIPDIEPENVDGDILFVEALLHTPDIVGTEIAPPGLVISQRPMRRKLDCSSQSRILTEDLIWCGSGEKEYIEDTRLGDPMGLS